MEPFNNCFKIFQLWLFLLCRVFNEESLKDYEHFRKQEVRDLREVLAAHIKTQMVLCKLVCYRFSQTKRDCHI